MRRNKTYRMGGFFTAFIATILVMGGVLCTVYLVMEAGANSSFGLAPVPNAYLPEAEDRMTILVAGRENSRTAPDLFLLVGFLPDQGKIAVCFLPPGTCVMDQGQDITLAGLYEKGGVRYTQKVLAEYLGVPVDRYAQADLNTLDKLLSYRGLMDYYLPVDLRYSLRGREVNMPKGDYQLDGRKAADILLCTEYGGGEIERSDRGGMFLSQMIQESLPMYLSDTGDQLTTNLLNWMETDLSYTDYERRKGALRFLAALDLPAAITIFLEGSEGDGGALNLSNDCLIRLKNTFGEAAQAAEQNGGEASAPKNQSGNYEKDFY